MQLKLLLIVLVSSFCVMACNVAANTCINDHNSSTTNNTSAHTYIIKGIGAYKIGNYEEAIKCYDRAITMSHENEIAEAGWAGKELAFYRQGKNEEALSCYCKLMNIDKDTNLIEIRKKDLANSLYRSAKVSSADNTTTDNISNIIKAGIIASMTQNVEKKTVIVMVREGAITTVKYLGKKEITGVAGAILAPEFVVPAMLVLTAYDAYSHRDELISGIKNIFDW